MSYLIIATIGLILIILTARLAYLEFRLKKIFKGSRGENLEKTLSALLKLSDDSTKKIIALENKTEANSEQLKKCLQKSSVVRFNPFRDAGSDQSFSLALLNDEKNGLVVSSLYGREINRIYAKPIEKGTSKYHLTDEEKEAVKQAR